MDRYNEGYEEGYNEAEWAGELQAEEAYEDGLRDGKKEALEDWKMEKNLLERIFNGSVVDFHIDNNFKLVNDVLIVRCTDGDYNLIVDKV